MHSNKKSRTSYTVFLITLRHDFIQERFLKDTPEKKKKSLDLAKQAIKIISAFQSLLISLNK